MINGYFTRGYKISTQFKLQTIIKLTRIYVFMLNIIFIPLRKTY